MGSRDDVVDDGLAPKVGGKAEAVNVGPPGVEEAWRNGAFRALSSCKRCCNLWFSIFSSRNVLSIAVFLLG